MLKPKSIFSETVWLVFVLLKLITNNSTTAAILFLLYISMVASIVIEDATNN